MKNLFKSNLCRFGIGILALAYACTNPEEVMYTYTDQNAFETQDNAIEAVNGIYAPFHSVSLATIYLNDLSTDACFKSENDFEILNDGKMSENSDVANAWNGYYQMISRANLVIDHLPDIDSEAFLDSKPSKERLLAEAYFLRAFAYYNLTDFFYKVPLVTDSEIKVTAKEPLAGIDAFLARMGEMGRNNGKVIGYLLMVVAAVPTIIGMYRSKNLLMVTERQL